MESDVRRHEVRTFGVGELVVFGLFLIGTHIGINKNARNRSINRKTALRFQGILFCFQEPIHFHLGCS